MERPAQIKTRCCSDYDALATRNRQLGRQRGMLRRVQRSDSDQGAGHQWIEAKAACEADVSAGVDKPRRLCTVMSRTRCALAGVYV